MKLCEKRFVHFVNFMVEIIVLQKAQFIVLVNKFQSSATLIDTIVPVRQRNARSEANIAAVNESVDEKPNLSVPHQSQEFGISQTSTWCILRKDFGLHPYKLQLTEGLKPNDHSLRRRLGFREA